MLSRLLISLWEVTMLIYPQALFLVDSTKYSSGIVSQYEPAKANRLGFERRYAGKYRYYPTDDDLVCAHRSLPFGTLLKITSKDQVAVCVVLDRGPYGYCEYELGASDLKCRSNHRYTVTTRKSKPGRYRGELDATPAVHKMLGSRGWVYAKIERINAPRKFMDVLKLRSSKQDSPLFTVSSLTRVRSQHFF